jgi:hypothetical protein
MERTSSGLGHFGLAYAQCANKQAEPAITLDCLRSRPVPGQRELKQ